MLIDEDYNRLALWSDVRMGGSREVPVAPFEAFFLSEEIYHLSVYIASAANRLVPQGHGPAIRLLSGSVWQAAAEE